MNKKRFYLVVAVGITMFFAACKKGESEPEIHGCPPIIGDRNISVVKMRIEAIKPSSGGVAVANELASAVKYENGILELNFPANVSDNYLGEYFWANASNIIPEGVTISDPQAKIGLLSVITYNSRGSYIGNFISHDSEWWRAQYIYADRSFTINGSSKHNLVFDCSFEKGWNIMYYNPLDGGIYTTQKPLDVDFEWRYVEAGCV